MIYDYQLTKRVEEAMIPNPTRHIVKRETVLHSSQPSFSFFFFFPVDHRRDVAY